MSTNNLNTKHFVVIHQVQEKYVWGTRRGLGQGKRKGGLPKVDDDTTPRYYKEYVVTMGLSIKDAWKIMRGDGIDVSYSD